jgi:pimeloyl-ACP methyl ester carboxylesterase
MRRSRNFRSLPRVPDRLPFVREAGVGSAVVCLHSNASHSVQWRGLMDRLSGRHRVLALDSYGAGKSPDWPSRTQISLQDEVDLIAPVLNGIEGSYTLVGHSYGGAVALKAALHAPQRVKALVLYEPTLFSLVQARSPAPNGVDGIRDAVAQSGRALDAGDKDAAARHFIDFWMGLGSWDATPEPRKPGIAESVTCVRRWAHALFTEPASLAEFARLNMPVLYMLGDKSPESAHAVARELLPVWPHAQVVRFAQMGHMAPVTHPDVVNPVVDAFLASQQ